MQREVSAGELVSGTEMDNTESLDLADIDPTKVDNEVLRRALDRVRKRLRDEIHAKHESHSSHSSHGTATW